MDEPMPTMKQTYLPMCKSQTKAILCAQLRSSSAISTNTRDMLSVPFLLLILHPQLLFQRLVLNIMLAASVRCDLCLALACVVQITENRNGSIAPSSTRKSTWCICKLCR